MNCMARVTWAIRFLDEFLHSEKPQTVSEISKKIGMHQAIGQRIIQHMLQEGTAILYNDTSERNNKKYYGPTPECLIAGIYALYSYHRDFQNSSTVRKTKEGLPVKHYLKEYEKLFEIWSNHEKFQVEVNNSMQMDGMQTEKEYHDSRKFLIEIWVKAQREYDKIKNDMPLKYQFLIGKEILKEKDPKFFQESLDYSEIDEYEGWAGK